jgi:hypothetical protein
MTEGMEERHTGREREMERWKRGGREDTENGE